MGWKNSQNRGLSSVKLGQWLFSMKKCIEKENYSQQKKFDRKLGVDLFRIYSLNVPHCQCRMSESIKENSNCDVSKLSTIIK